MKELKGSENSDEIDASLNSILIAEHARLSSLYQYNAGMGEKLITTYLTIISIVVGLFISIPQLIPLGSNSITIELTLIILAFVIGCITFLRLIERRGRSVEYLRGINRIHRFYVDHFPEIEEHLTWDACDDCPPMGVKGTSIGGLRDMVAGLNSIFFGFGIGLMLNEAFHQTTILWPLVGGVCAVILLWFGHRFVKSRRLKQLEDDMISQIHFPKRNT
jgi:hypothetical protein